MTRERIEDMREVVLPFVKKRLLETNYEGLGESDAEEFTRDFNEILDLAIKALEQEPKKGHWIKTGDYYTGAYGSIEYVDCSCCHESSLEEGDFCPNCGAKMAESEET